MKCMKILIGVLILCFSDAITIEDLNKRVTALEAQFSTSNSCGDWTPFKDEKCFKIFKSSGAMTIYEQAYKICNSQPEQGSTLPSIRSPEEEQFLVEFLFNTNKVHDDVWLGAKRSKSNPKVFEWDDHSDFSYTNWNANDPTGITDRNCMQFKYDLSVNKSALGKWEDVPCDKENLVVCQRMQKWSILMIENRLLDMRKGLTDAIENLRKDQNNALKKTNNQLTDSVTRVKNDVSTLQNNPVPLGFIYVQLPNQPEPHTLWPNVQWQSVSANYAGLFFRVSGGASDPFNKKEPQEPDSPRLIHIDSTVKQPDAIAQNIVANGKPSGKIFTGGVAGDRAQLDFVVSGGEVRPRNKAVMVWKRIK